MQPNVSGLVSSMTELVVRDGTSFSDTTNIDWSPYMQTHLTTKRLNVALFVCVLYEFVVTTDDSVNLFWLHRWSISKILFLLNRVNSTLLLCEITLQNFVFNASTKFCKAAPWLEFTGSTILIAIFNLALLIRVYALWNRSLFVYYACVAVFILHVGSYIGIVIYSNTLVVAFPSVAPFTGCYVVPGYSRSYIIFFTSIAFETFVIVLTVIKAYPVARQRGVKTPLFSLLLEDGLMYYFIIIFAQVVTVIAIFSDNLNFCAPVLGAYMAVAVAGIACNRLLLRPQRLLVSGNPDLDTTFQSHDLRTMTARAVQGNNPSSPVPSFNKDLPRERLEMDGRRKSSNWNSTGSSRLSKKRPSLIRTPQDRSLVGHVHQPSSQSYMSGASLDKEIDLSGQYLMGITVQREDVHQVEGGRDSMQGDSIPITDVGPFNYGSRRHVLDSTRVASPEADETGHLTISRIGRYD